MSRPTLSVVIPCYNAERYIAATLRSVLAQGWPDLEVIVVDDGSSDRSIDCVARQFPGVKLLRQDNRGAGAARNLGIRHASAGHVAFIDADDLWLPGKLQLQWQLLQDRPDVRMVYGAWHVWHSGAVEPDAGDLAQLLAIADDVRRWEGATGWVYTRLLLDCVVWTSTVLTQRSLLEEIGPFDESLRIGEDYDLWLRASRVTPILRVPRPLALYRIHPHNITRRAPTANHRGIVVQRALARWGHTGPDGASADPGDVRRALASSWSAYAGAQLLAGNMTEARASGIKSVRTDWRHVPGWKTLLKACALSLQPRTLMQPGS